MAEERNPAVIPSFLKFSEQPFYVDLNMRFIRSLGLRGDELVLDLASGPGNTSKILDQELGPGGVIVALDISEISLRYANRLSFERPFSVVQGTADKLPFSQKGSGHFDVVFCGNSIHNFSDKKGTIREVCRVSKDHALFAFNSTFYDGAIHEEQVDFYKDWLKQAINLLKQRGVTRDKKLKVEARKQLTPDEYMKIVKNNGFEVTEMSVETVDVTLDGFKAIAEDDEFVALLSGYPPDQAKKALSDAAEIVFKGRNMKSLPRDWMKVIAIKKSERVLELAV